LTDITSEWANNSRRFFFSHAWEFSWKVLLYCIIAFYSLYRMYGFYWIMYASAWLKEKEILTFFLLWLRNFPYWLYKIFFTLNNTCYIGYILNIIRLCSSTLNQFNGTTEVNFRSICDQHFDRHIANSFNEFETIDRLRQITLRK